MLINQKKRSILMTQKSRQTDFNNICKLINMLKIYERRNYKFEFKR